MDKLKETDSSVFLRTFLKNPTGEDSEKKILLLALEAKSNLIEFSEEIERLGQKDINLIQNRVFDIFNSTLEDYANNQEDYIREEQLTLGKNLSIFLKSVAKYNECVDESIYNKIDNKTAKIEKTLNEYNKKSREDLLIEDLLNEKMPNQLSHYELGKVEHVFSYDKESLKKSLIKLEDKDYKKIISTLDNAYKKITQDISDRLASGETDEFKNFNTHTPSEDFSRSQETFEKIILEAKKEKNYNVSQKMLKKFNKNYDQVTNGDLFLSKIIEDRTNEDINTYFFNGDRNSFINSVQKMSNEDFEKFQIKTMDKISNVKSLSDKTILALETLATARKETLLDTVANSIKFHLNASERKANEEAKMQHAKNSCSSATFTKK